MPASSTTCAESGAVLFRSEALRGSVTDDVIGLEYCTVTKNVAAIGLGILDGLGKEAGFAYRNARAALFAQAVAELGELIVALGGRPETITGLAGLGDTLVTSLGGRNRLYGELESADQAAVGAMRLLMDTVSMNGVVVIGEGEKDEAPMLFNGEHVGNGEGPEVDVAVDPLEGTRLTANGQPNAIAVVAVAERGSMFFPGAAVYMDKIAGGPEAAAVIDIEAPPAENVRRVAKAKGKRPEEVSVVVLDRERHQDLIAALR